MFDAQQMVDPYRFLERVGLVTGRSRASQIHTVLRQAIIRLDLPPGATIRKEEIAARFGVSRTPVSEALGRLADEGLVEVLPQRGSFVSRIRMHDVDEAAFLREALEVAIVRAVAPAIDARQVAELRRNLRRQEAALSGGELEAFHRHDEDLHGLLCRFVGYPRLQTVVDRSRAQLDRARRLLLPVPGRVGDTLDEHRAIVDALAARDADAAEEAMRHHLRRTPAILASMAAGRPDLFDERVLAINGAPGPGDPQRHNASNQKREETPWETRIDPH